MKISEVQSWEELSRFGKNRVIQSSYIWLFLVPLAAKALSTVESPLIISGLSDGLKINLHLPFSWYLFYVSALAFTFATALYALSCPKIIRRYANFRDFEAEGQKFSFLRSYSRDLEGFAFSRKVTRAGGNITSPRNELSIDEEPRELNSTAFWELYNFENDRSAKIRLSCQISYYFGFGCTALVLLQNFWFVISSFLNLS